MLRDLYDFAEKKVECWLTSIIKYNTYTNLFSYWDEQGSISMGTEMEGLMPLISQRTSEKHLHFQIRLANLDKDSHKTEEIADLVNDSIERDYPGAARRITSHGILNRLYSKEDVKAGIMNRVLFVAEVTGEEKAIPIGVIAATLVAPWQPLGTGSWGLLSVRTGYEGLGVARALVRHAEHYLKVARMRGSGIEYTYLNRSSIRQDDADHNGGAIAWLDTLFASSERLRSWYEDRLGYQCVACHNVGSFHGMKVKDKVIFRFCYKSFLGSKKEREAYMKSVAEKNVIVVCLKYLIIMMCRLLLQCVLCPVRNLIKVERCPNERIMQQLIHFLHEVTVY